MIFPNLTREITLDLARQYSQQNRALTISNYERRYRELEGDVKSTESDRQYYWPKRYNESIAAYAERVKVWTQLPRIICQRLTSVILGGKVERKWEAINDASQPHADRANELQEYMDELDDWESQISHITFYALGIGEIALWPEFRIFDKTTGEAHKIAGGQGVTSWCYYFPWFVEPISVQEYASEVIGAVKILYMDGQTAHPLVSRSLSVSGTKDILEMYLAPQYDRMSGQQVSQGFYRRWVDEKPDYPLNGKGQPDETSWNKNPYGCNPVVFFCSGDPDETQYRGKSYLDRFADLAIQHSRTISDIGQAIECLPNIWTYTGDQKDIEKVVIRSNSVVSVPLQGNLSQAVSNLKLDENWKLVEYLEKTISLAGAIPAEVWDMLGSAGKVESAVALKLVMQPMAENVNLIRKSIGKSERQRMRTTVKMWNAYNKNEIDLSAIRPEVNYHEEIIPVDMAVAIVNDLSLLGAKVKSLPDLVKKYNPNITTDEQAQTFIEEQAANAPKPPLFNLAFNRPPPPA